MFNAYEFLFNGESSLTYDLMLYDYNGKGQSDIPFGNQANILEVRPQKRVQPIHFGVDYNSRPLEFTLVFGADRYLTRQELEKISFWLTGHQEYKWLSIVQDDLSHVQFKCLFTKLTPISHGWLPVAFEATVRCDCPYAYGLPFQKSYDISGETQLTIQNEGTVHEYFKPNLVFTTSDVGGLSIVNHSDGDREFLITDLPSAAEISIDNRNGIILDTTFGTNLYGGFNANFFRMVPGENSLTVTGSGTLIISGRFLHNVAG